MEKKEVMVMNLMPGVDEMEGARRAAASILYSAVLTYTRSFWPVFSTISAKPD